MGAHPEYARLPQSPRSTFLLFGPRSTGKSTWARGRMPGATRFDLLAERLYRPLLADPGLFGDRLRTATAGSWVRVDGIQRLPSFLNEVHRFSEERRLKFALTGSSARQLRRSGVNLLGGRAIARTTYPFLPEEPGGDFDLESALRFGTIPIVLASEDRDETLRACVGTSLKEEIRAEAVVRNLAGFARFLPVAGLFHGQVPNTAGLSRDAGVARTTVEGFLGILEDTLFA